MVKVIHEWQSVINGKSYSFSYQLIKRKPVLYINGVPQSIKIGWISLYLGVDEEISFDCIVGRFVMFNGKPDIAVNNIYLQSGKPYIKRPAWVLVFVIFCITIPITAMGGAIPILLGIGGTMLCITVSKTQLPVVVRVLLCLAITVAAWMLMFDMARLFARLF